MGVDPHKRLHVAQVVDEAGEDLAAWHGPNSADGWASLAGWASNLGPAPMGPELWVSSGGSQRGESAGLRMASKRIYESPRAGRGIGCVIQQAEVERAGHSPRFDRPRQLVLNVGASFLAASMVTWSSSATSR
jgi:hypothetical protein